MKLLFSLLVALFMTFQAPTFEMIRDSYPTAAATKSSANKFFGLVEKSATADPVAKAYKFAANVIKAKFETGPNRKTLLVHGIKGLESVISANPRNVELRVIRLSLQENLPKIVGYNSKIQEDKGVILRGYPNQNSALKQYIRNFAATSRSMTPAEKSSFK